MNLKEEIGKLSRLQEADSRIYHLMREKDIDKPAHIENIKKQFDEKKKCLDSCANMVKQLQVKKKEKELELATKEENIKKSQGQLFQLKSNKDYQIKLTEIASLKADASVLEEDVIKVLDEIEIAEKKLQEAKGILAQEEKGFKEEETKINVQIKDIETEIKVLNDKRGTLLGDIDKTILAKYEQLLKTRLGLAIAPVDLARENCGACHMRITPQTINEMKMYKNLVLCESCVRILYIPDDFAL
ncbi:MAG: C4-type zinc ribbon domain-containing protein [Candidatus Omnitrophota bacterium]